MSETLTPGKSAKYTKYDNTPSWIQVVSEKYIPGGGAYGRIYQTETLVLGRPRRFIVKKFLGDPTRAKQGAERAFNNYRRAKKAGLKVFPTYRISGDRTSILMTDGNADSAIALSNNRTLFELGLPQIKDEAIPSTLTDSIIQHAKLAADHNILIPSDAYFFIYNRRLQTTDFILGDLDRLGSDITTHHALWHNLKTARKAVMSFLANNSESPYLQIRRADLRFRSEGETGN